MVTRLAAVAVCVALASPAFAGLSTYDFSGPAATSATTPTTIGLATFFSPSDPGAFTFGPNAGLYTDLGAYVLSSAGTVATLTINFATSQDAVGFDFSVGDFLGGGGAESITVTASNGASSGATAALVGSDFYPEGTFSLSGAGSFTSLTITSVYALTIADLTSVPEPAALALFGAGLAGLIAARRRA